MSTLIIEAMTTINLQSENITTIQSKQVSCQMTLMPQGPGDHLIQLVLLIISKWNLVDHLQHLYTIWLWCIWG